MRKLHHHAIPDKRLKGNARQAFCFAFLNFEFRILLFAFCVLFFSESRAQGGAPVTIVPSWDELYPARLPELPVLPVDANVLTKEGIRVLSRYEQVTPKKKSKKTNGLLLLSTWEVDKDGHLLRSGNYYDGKQVTSMHYVPVNKLSSWCTRFDFGEVLLDSFSVLYNRSGSPELLMHTITNGSEHGALGATHTDTSRLLYNSKQLEVVCADLSEKRIYAFGYDAEGRLVRRMVTQKDAGPEDLDSIAYRKMKGVLVAEHYYRSYDGNPPAFSLIDKVLIDSASGKILEYNYLFPMGNGNSTRGVQAGEKITYEYAHDRLIHRTKQSGDRVNEDIHYQRNENGDVIATSRMIINWAKTTKEKIAYDYEETKVEFNAQGIPQSETFRVYTGMSKGDSGWMMTGELKKEARNFKYVFQR